MVIKLYQLIFYFLLSKIIKTESQCPKIKCNEPKKEGESCLQYSEHQVNISICLEDNKYCPIQSDIFENVTLYCSNKPKKHILIYPGINCDTDERCITKKCENNKCDGKKLNEPCEFDIDCINGHTCIDNKCVLLRKIGEKCEKDSNCILSAGCHNLKCTEYFSLNDGEIVNQDNYFNDGLSFCKGGTAINGKCITLKLNNPKKPCDKKKNICTYSYNENGTSKNLTLIDNCVCGYNIDGLSYCKLGGGDTNYTRFIKNKMEYLKNTDNCHTIEHGINNVCHFDEGLEAYFHFLNYELWALYNYQLYNAPECVIKNAFPDYNNALDSNEISEMCGKFTCEYKENINEICLIKNNTNSEINIKLLYNDSVNSPNKKYKCLFNKLNLYQIYIENIYYEKDKNDDYYDGDYCEEKCINEKFNISLKCENNTCKIIKDDNKCYEHNQCSAGQFCNNGNCEKQKRLNEYCLEDYACENHLICYNSICKDYLLKKKVGEISNRQIACYYNLIDKGVCMMKKRRNQTLNLYDDFIKCKDNNDCSYYKFKSNQTNSSLLEIGKDFCECGFRRDKIKYCPLISNDFPYLWEKYVKLYRSLSRNKCHTLKRYSCSKWKVENKSLYEEFISLKIFFEKGHLFYKSDDCVEYLLNENFLSFNKVFLILIYLFIIS